MRVSRPERYAPVITTIARRTRRCLDPLRVTAIGGIALLAVLVHFGPGLGIHPFAIRGSSMAPTIPFGSVVLARETDPASIRAGDVVTIRADNGVLITHRVIRVVTDRPDLSFQTQGDANPAPDGMLVPARSIVGQVVLFAPLVGFIMAMLASPAGTVSIGAFLILLMMIGRFLREVERGAASVRDGSTRDGTADVLAT